MATDPHPTPRRGSYADHALEFPELASADAALRLTYEALEATHEDRFTKIRHQYGERAERRERRRLAPWLAEQRRALGG